MHLLTQQVYRLALLCLVLVGTTTFAHAQKGQITGVIVDEQTGETLIGANVLIEGTTLGAQSSLDGSYIIRDVDPGVYTLVVSYISYTTRRVSDVQVAPGATVRLDLALASASLGLEEITVTAEVVRNSEAGLLRMQARAPAISDGISAQQMRRAPDASSSDALRRVTGVSVVGGRFVFVRGIPERYNGTLLNGTAVPSTEPDRRAFAYDLVPANLLENIIVTKSATPDLPGDFSGGLMQLTTVDFPAEPTLSFSASGGLVGSTTGENFAHGPRGSRDGFGFDDGRRALPQGFPTSNVGDLPQDQALQAARLLQNNWAIGQRAAPVNQNASLSAGNTFTSRVGDIGVVAALTYRSGYTTQDITRREYEGGDQLRFDYAGNQFTYNVAWGGIANLSYRPNGFHSVSFKNFYSRVADDEYTSLLGPQFTDAGREQSITALRYLERSVYSGQLVGDHFFRTAGPQGVTLRWEAYRAYSTRNEPDYRRVYYDREIGSDDPFSLVIGPTVSLKTGGRFFSDLNENGYGAMGRVILPYGEMRITAGGGYDGRDRAFTSRLLGVITPRRNFDNALRLLPLEEIFNPANFGRLNKPGCENGGRGCEGFELSESQAGSSDYIASQHVGAGFVMIDAPLSMISPNLRLVGGVRLEQSVQKLEATDFQGSPINVRAPRTNWMPSANLTYRVSDQTNVRMAYSRNVNRPELRELAPFAYFDFELQTTVYGNPDLKQATIDNYDLRFETYPAPGQMLSVSAFMKHFKNAIERVIVPGVALNAERSFANASDAYNTGIEVEGRFSLARISNALRQSSVVANYSWIRSEVNVAGSGAVIERTGRPLQGQSPYAINLGFTYVAPRLETQATILYNRLGSRISELSSNFEEDVRELPRDQIDFTLSQPIGRRFEFRVAARDVLNQQQRYSQGEDIIRINQRGRTLSMGISLKY